MTTQKPKESQDDDDVASESTLEADKEAIQQAAATARATYEGDRGRYEDYSRSISAILRKCIEDEDLAVHSITFRAKSPESFERKAARISPDDPRAARYEKPLEQITDKAGVRVITYFLSTVQKVAKIISDQFEVVEAIERKSPQPDRLGYKSFHYLVRYKDDRTKLPEYSQFTGLFAELQVRTILQHTWAEIEHDIQYKATNVLPSPIRSRFAALAGLIEIADREFQAIEEADQELRKEAKKKVNLGQLDQVEITGDSLKAYLDRKYRADGRMAEWSYNWTADLLIRLGFANLAEVDECISGYDDNLVSRTLYGGRMGQLTRFEAVVLASMGKYFILPHRWTDIHNPWYIRSALKSLEKLNANEISTGTYRPANYPVTELKAEDLQRIADDFEKNIPLDLTTLETTI